MSRGLTALEGGERMYCVPGSIVRHLTRYCPRLVVAKRVVEVREVDLWPGFVCQWCREHHEIARPS